MEKAIGVEMDEEELVESFKKLRMTITSYVILETFTKVIAKKTQTKGH